MRALTTRVFLLITVIVFAVGGHAGALESFSAGALPPGWRVSNGSIELSTRRYKDDGQSLLWNWQAGSHLIFADEDTLWGISGITGWIYNEQPTEEKLVFRAGPTAELKKGNAAYTFEFNLNFSGWRWLGVGLVNDARVADYKGSRRIEQIEFIAPSSGSGKLYIDRLDFPKQLPTWLPPDRQLPFVNPNEVGIDLAGQLLYYDRMEMPKVQLGPDFAQKSADVDKIEQRYLDWVLGLSVDWNNPLVKKRYQGFMTEVLAAKSSLETEFRTVDRNNVLVYKPLLPNELGRMSPFEDIFKHLGLLATAYHTEGPKTFKNPFYHDAKLLKTILEVFNHLHDQGFAAGSSFGSNNRFIRTTIGGYANAVFLMRNELKEAGIWEREMETLRWYSGFGEVYRTDTFSGAVTGDIRTVFNRLLYVLGLDDPEQRVLNMGFLARWMEQALSIAPGAESFIKSDYTGYTHYGAIGNTYTTTGLNTAAAFVYLLDGTAFDIPQKTNVWQALLQARVYSNKYDIPSALACRWPFMTNSLYELLPAFSYGALVDTEVAKAFKRLWDPTDPQVAKVVEQADVSMSYLNTIGAASVLVQAANMDVEPEPTPNGHWYLPHGGVAIHRRNEWMVSLRGWSKYIWNFELQPIHMGAQNLYGRYMSHGAMQIYGTGNPVSAQASGYSEAGWDWNRWPGTTAIYLPWEKLQETQSNYARHFTNETFMGGVVMDGKDGVWAMRLVDPIYEVGFTAQKSVFAFGKYLIALGSGITNKNTMYPTETTVYQTRLVGEEMATAINYGGQSATLPNTFTGDGRPLWLVDGVGNGYFIPNSSQVRATRRVQSTPLNNASGYGQGLFEVVWFDHGKAPIDAGYEYVVFPQVSVEEMEQLVAQLDYTVVRKDATAHIVTDHTTGYTGYALFKAGENLEGVVSGVDTPVLILVRDDGTALDLAITDPDLGYKTRMQSQWRVQVTMKGAWQISDDSIVEIVKADAHSTTLSILVTGGETTQLHLCKQ